MENLSPSRIQPLSPGQQKDQDAAPAKKSGKPPGPRKAPPASPSVDAESDERHQLDEQA